MTLSKDKTGSGKVLSWQGRNRLPAEAYINNDIVIVTGLTD